MIRYVFIISFLIFKKTVMFISHQLEISKRNLVSEIWRLRQNYERNSYVLQQSY